MPKTTLSTEDTREIFKFKVNDLSLNLPFLAKIVRYEDYLRDYPQIVFSFLELVKHISERYSGCTDANDAAKPVSESSDRVLNQLYDNF